MSCPHGAGEGSLHVRHRPRARRRRGVRTRRLEPRGQAGGRRCRVRVAVRRRRDAAVPAGARRRAHRRPGSARVDGDRVHGGQRCAARPVLRPAAARVRDRRPVGRLPAGPRHRAAALGDGGDRLPRRAPQRGGARGRRADRRGGVLAHGPWADEPRRRDGVRGSHRRGDRRVHPLGQARRRSPGPVADRLLLGHQPRQRRAPHTGGASRARGAAPSVDDLPDAGRCRRAAQPARVHPGALRPGPCPGELRGTRAGEQHRRRHAAGSPGAPREGLGTTDRRGGGDPRRGGGA